MEIITTEIVKSAVGWMVAAVLGAFVSGIVTRQKMSKKKHTANNRGTRCLLRAEILRDHKEYVGQKGYCPVYAKEALEDAFAAYEELGGNGMAKRKYMEIMDLPDYPHGGEEDAE